MGAGLIIVNIRVDRTGGALRVQPLRYGRSRYAGAVVGIVLLTNNVALADTAILVALPAEQSALSREVRIVSQPVEMAQHRISIGYHKGEKLYIVRTGAGNLNSAMVTQALLTRGRRNGVASLFSYFG